MSTTQIQQQQKVQAPKTIVSEIVIPAGIKYPVVDKKIWGGPYWFTFHQRAAMFPDNPTEEHRTKHRQYIDDFIHNLPCKIECGDSAKHFCAANPPDLSSRKAYFGWTVKFHNWVNQERGDPERVNADDILEAEASCDKTGRCSLPDIDDSSAGPGLLPQEKKEEKEKEAETKKEGTPTPAAHKINLSHSFESYKNAVRQLVTDVCHQRGKEPPQMFFSKCADGTETSCMVNLTLNNGTKKQVLFYHPKQLVDIILHEIDHHLDATDGKKINDSLNPKADKFASDMISNHFPYDKTVYTKDGNIAIAHDTTIIRDSMPIPPASSASATGANAKAMVQEVYGAPNQFSTEIEDPKILNDFPHLKQTLMEIKKEELKGEIKEFEHRGGVLSHLDTVYSYPAKLTGLTAEQLNILHTPTIVSEIIFTISGAFLAPLPRRVAVGLFAVFLMLMGIGFHKKMSTRDIMFVQAIGAQLLWGSTITILNPKNLRKLKKDAERLTELAKSHNLHARDLIETPGEDTGAFHPTIQALGGGGKGNAVHPNLGRPIKQGVNPIESSVDEVENPDFYESLSDQSVIHLPKFSSRSHARFA